jgi:hypothetical protein
MQDLQDIKVLLKSIVESLNVIAERVDIHGGF